MANGFSIELLRTIVDDFEALKEMEENEEAFPIFFEPSSIDNRIINQYALFSVGKCIENYKSNKEEYFANYMRYLLCADVEIEKQMI